MKCHYRHVPLEAFPEVLRPAVAADRMLEAAVHEAIDAGKYPANDQRVLVLAATALQAWGEAVGYDDDLEHFITASLGQADVPEHLAKSGLADPAVEPEAA